jgi:hypothetical protein
MKLRMRWVGHVAWGRRDACRDVVRESEGKRHWEDLDVGGRVIPY